MEDQTKRVKVEEEEDGIDLQIHPTTAKAYQRDKGSYQEPLENPLDSLDDWTRLDPLAWDSFGDGGLLPIENLACMEPWRQIIQRKGLVDL